MGSTNFTNATLNLVVLDQGGIVTTASLKQTDTSFVSSPLIPFKVTLTNAQVLTLESTPVVIVPKTQTLNHSGFPTSLPIPVSVTAVLDSQAGAYTNIDVGNQLGLAWGTNYDSDVGFSAHFSGVNFSISKVSAGADKQTFSFVIYPDVIGNGYLLDNALVVTMLNGGSNLTGGNAANTMTVSGLYYVQQL